MDNFNPPPRISLRPLTSDDIEDFLVWAMDDRVTSHLSWESYRNREDALRFLIDVVEPHLFFMAICLQDRVIGAITLNHSKPHTAEIGYAIAYDYWGKGYITEAIKEAVTIGLGGVNRIEAFVDPQNIGSQKALEKAGFKQVDYLIKHTMHRKELRDRILYRL